MLRVHDTACWLTRLGFQAQRTRFICSSSTRRRAETEKTGHEQIVPMADPGEGGLRCSQADARCDRQHARFQARITSAAARAAVPSPLRPQPPSGATPRRHLTATLGGPNQVFPCQGHSDDQANDESGCEADTPGEEISVQRASREPGSGIVDQVGDDRTER